MKKMNESGKIQKLADQIKSAESILLTTHRQCDGDGLGSELAMFHSLKKLGKKKVRILNVDSTPKKYQFLSTDQYVQCYDGVFAPLSSTDLALIFDTNDSRMVEPLYSQLKQNCKKIIFVDHHPILEKGPLPTRDSLINTSSASCGELTFDLIRAFGVSMDPLIARALYTSLVFDTQIFRYVRDSSRSHEIAIELLKHEKKPSEIHRRLFGNFNSQKLKFIANCLNKVEFFEDEKIAILHICHKELKSLGLGLDDSLDLIEIIINVENVVATVVFREDRENHFKLSMRSKGEFPVLDIAEKLGGGGHLFASGAFIKGDYETLKKDILQALVEKVH